MEEKSAEFFEKYEITVTGTVRTRGAYRIETERGPKLLMPYGGSENRAVFEQRVLGRLRECGFSVDGYVENKEGKYVTQDEYGESFLLKDWYYGEECNVKKTEQVIAAVQNLAGIHKNLSGIEVSAEELPGAVQRSLPALFEKRNRELRRVRAFIREKRRKVYFETVYLNIFSEFYEKAEAALAEAKQKDCAATLEDAKNAGNICHGMYTHHNLLLLSDGSFATVNFDKACIGVQISDFYLFFRKLMEKTGWNRQLAEEMMEAYMAVRPVEKREWQIFYLLLSYPEKFWKITNSYHNGKKTWIPQKTTEKLLAVKEQEREKQALLEQIICRWC
ncbi:MAG: CotS family spore coat protein [Lachnospiraceae bacterium]|nr:CotS family spore coat protein [Lachnospiraceae bacterium]